MKDAQCHSYEVNFKVTKSLKLLEYVKFINLFDKDLKQSLKIP